jgi:hypothetical protein
MHHEHLKFYNNSLQNSSNGPRKSVTLGGVDLVPGLVKQEKSENDSVAVVDQRSSLEKQVEIVEYLKRLPGDSKVILLGCLLMNYPSLLLTSSLFF